MNKKYIAYAILPVMAFGLLGISQASAHGWFKMGGNLTPQEIADKHQAMFQEQASLLGLSIDAVKNAWSEGKSLKQLANENNITDEQLKTKLQAAAKVKMGEHLKALVDKGIITQAQADKRLQLMEQKVQNKQGLGFKMGRHMSLGF